MNQSNNARVTSHGFLSDMKAGNTCATCMSKVPGFKVAVKVGAEEQIEDTALSGHLRTVARQLRM